jgi:hypothetical protein
MAWFGGEGSGSPPAAFRSRLFLEWGPGNRLHDRILQFRVQPAAVGEAHKVVLIGPPPRSAHR